MTEENEYFTPVQLNQWDVIIDRYKNYADDLVPRTIVLPLEELQWLDSILKNTITDIKGQPHTVSAAVLFCQQSKYNKTENSYNLGIHIDHVDDAFLASKDSWGLNIPILNCDQGEMIWYGNKYKLREVNTQGRKDYTINWLQGPVKKISKIIDTPHIVNVGIPHQVINHSNNFRIMLSVRFVPGIKTEYILNVDGSIIRNPNYEI
jgi:hypothetical protein